MHPELTEEQAELQAAVERFWRQQVTAEKLLAWENEADGIDAASWRAVSELGWFGIAVPAESGGSGLGLIEVACVVEECARGLIPRRVIEAIRGATALADLAPDAAELPALASGHERLTLAIDERAARSVEHMRSRVAGDRLSGEKWCVLDPRARWHLVAAHAQGEAVLALVDGSQAELARLRSFDGSEQAAVSYRDIRVQRTIGTGSGGGALRRLQRVQSALALAEMVGGMRAALDATVAYVQEREQFGQKIALFQAVQHQIADMALAHTASRHLAWRAIAKLANGTEEGTELAVAAVFVARSFKDITMSAHHLHGGAGYVVEHPLHYHSERAEALAIRYAPEAAALDDVARQLLDDG